jgi:hypothetical protein
MNTPTRLDRYRGLCHVSSHMPLEKAKRRAKKLQNLSTILGVEIVDVRKDGTARVQWQPKGAKSQDRDLKAFLAEREERAIEQSAVMSFHPNSDVPGQYAAVNDDLHGQVVHAVDLANHECDCPDYQHRCLRVSEFHGTPVPCHHIIELKRRLLSEEPLVRPGSILLATQPETAEQADYMSAQARFEQETEIERQSRRERLKAERDTDFPN